MSDENPKDGTTYIDSYETDQTQQLFTVIVMRESMEGGGFSLYEEDLPEIRVCHIHAKDTRDVHKRVKEFFEERRPYGPHRILTILHGLVSRADWTNQRRR